MLDTIKSDPWRGLNAGEREKRALGSAMSVALALCQSYSCQGARIELMVGGPTTLGKGVVAGMKHSDMIRSYLNIEKGDEKAQLFEAS